MPALLDHHNSYAYEPDGHRTIRVPTVNFNVGTNAGGGGGHAWYEWGIPGNGQDEGKRVYRMILMGLMAAGYHTSDGKVVPPLASPGGKRTTEELYK